jgi:hypothetical protein
VKIEPRAAMEHNLAHASAVASSASRIVTMVRQGQVGQLLASLPPASRGPVEAAIRSGFAAGLNDLLIVTGILALIGSLCSLLLIRSKARRSQQSVWRTDPQAPAPGSEQPSLDGTSPVRSA